MFTSGACIVISKQPQDDWYSIDIQAYVARIAEVNNTLHIVTEINPDALEIAAQLDAERATGSVRG